MSLLHRTDAYQKADHWPPAFSPSGVATRTVLGWICRARWIAISIFCAGLFLPAATAYAQLAWWKIPPDREQIDADAQAFQALDSQTMVVLGTDNNLWLEHAPFGHAPPAREQIDANAQAFQALDSQTVVVLGTDNKLWLEHAPFGHVPPAREQIDANAQAFRALDSQTVVVLGTDNKLWLEHASVPRP